ncbi:MAG: FliA/WhiG family RNA polymerase sigma factor [Planctomycetota bacterium]
MARIRTATRKPTPEQAEAIKKVWVKYKAKPTEAMRNELMEFYLPLVRYNAERVHTKLPDEVDVDDLMSAGIFGLMDAIDAFDMERGVKFETYCAPRIRGAILDELRSMDWVPRLVRSRSSQVNQARGAFEMEHGRAPTDEELCDKIGVDQDEYAKIRKDAGAVSTVSLSRKWFETDSNKDVREIDVLKDTRQINPLTAVQKRDLKDVITKGLTRAERLIIILYYYEEMTMKEIGVTLDLSESRVSQMHSSILARLKAQLQHRTTDIEDEI